MPSSSTLLLLILLALTAVNAAVLDRTTSAVKVALDRQVAYRRPKSSGIKNRKNAIYTAEIGVGTPPRYYTLIIDTGSSVTWVGNRNKTHPYIPTSTSVFTGYGVDLEYGIGLMIGELWTDTVTISPGVVAREQPIGVKLLSEKLPYDGILGLGPVALTDRTVVGVEGTKPVILNMTIPTVMDTLWSDNQVPSEVVGLHFTPYSPSNQSGELTFGEVDESVTTTPVHYVPVTKSLNASHYWGVDVSINYGNSETVLPLTAGIVDSGTTFILLAEAAYKRYQRLTGATLAANGLLQITAEQYANLRSLTLYIGGEPLVLSPNAQIRPRRLNHEIDGSADAIYLIVGGLNSTPVGIDVILGVSFHERYYVVYDTHRNRLGFAETKYTFADSN